MSTSIIVPDVLSTEKCLLKKALLLYNKGDAFFPPMEKKISNTTATMEESSPFPHAHTQMMAELLDPLGLRVKSLTQGHINVGTQEKLGIELLTWNLVDGHFTSLLPHSQRVTGSTKKEPLEVARLPLRISLVS